MQETGNNTPVLKTTAQVARQLTLAHSTVLGLLTRYEHLKPKTKIDAGDWLWTDEEIEYLRRHRATHKGGKPRKQQA